MTETLYSPDELAVRWQSCIKTLSQWRWNGRGPKYRKIGRKIFYSLTDIEEFEERQRRSNTSMSGVILPPVPSPPTLLPKTYLSSRSQSSHSNKRRINP